MANSMGALTSIMTTYEFVTITEMQVQGIGQGITVTLKNPICASAKQTAP